jgi:hypothetical protein
MPLLTRRRESELLVGEVTVFDEAGGGPRWCLPRHRRSPDRNLYTVDGDGL